MSQLGGCLAHLIKEGKKLKNNFLLIIIRFSSLNVKIFLKKIYNILTNLAYNLCIVLRLKIL